MPKLLSTDEISIAKIQIGAMYFIITTNIFSLLNLPVSAISSVIVFGFIT